SPATCRQSLDLQRLPVARVQKRAFHAAAAVGDQVRLEKTWFDIVPLGEGPHRDLVEQSTWLRHGKARHEVYDAWQGRFMARLPGCGVVQVYQTPPVGRTGAPLPSMMNWRAGLSTGWNLWRDPHAGHGLHSRASCQRALARRLVS